MLATTNIFLNPYEQAENKLTYGFLSLLEHVDIATSLEIVQRLGVPQKTADELAIRLLYGGGEGNPDGGIAIGNAGQRTDVLFENKTFRRPIDLNQIKNHLKLPNCDHLLILTTDKNDLGKLNTINDRRIIFYTWEGFLSILDQISSKTDAEPDSFLLKQFIEYLERSNEVRRPKMISKELIEAHSRYLALWNNEEDQFLKQSEILMGSVRETIVHQFKDEIGSSSINNRWGRLGVECVLKKRPLKQWLFFGIYYDYNNHGILFKNAGEAEFAVFFDLIEQPDKYRLELEAVANISGAKEDLKRQGFEFNFPSVTKGLGNKWRVAYWRQSMLKHVGKEPSELADLFKRVLTNLFESDFYKKARDLPVVNS
jgi:hypothetical protein